MEASQVQKAGADPSLGKSPKPLLFIGGHLSRGKKTQNCIFLHSEREREMPFHTPQVKNSNLEGQKNEATTSTPFR